MRLLRVSSGHTKSSAGALSAEQTGCARRQRHDRVCTRPRGRYRHVGRGQCTAERAVLDTLEATDGRDRGWYECARARPTEPESAVVARLDRCAGFWWAESGVGRDQVGWDGRRHSRAMCMQQKSESYMMMIIIIGMKSFARTRVSDRASTHRRRATAVPLHMIPRYGRRSVQPIISDGRITDLTHYTIYCHYITTSLIHCQSHATKNARAGLSNFELRARASCIVPRPPESLVSLPPIGIARRALRSPKAAPSSQP